MASLIKSLSLVVSIAAIAVTASACQKDDAKTAPAAKAAAAPAAAAPAQAKADTTKVATRAEGQAKNGSCAGGACGASCGGGSCGGSCGGGEAQAAPAVPSDATWTTVSVVGMRCGGCEGRVKRTLSEIEGVLAVKADHKTGKVLIATRTSAPKLREQAGPRIAKLGFHMLSK